MMELAYFTFGALLGVVLYANRDLIPRPTPRRKRGAVSDPEAFLYGKHKIHWWHLREADEDIGKRRLSLREYAKVSTYSDS